MARVGELKPQRRSRFARCVAGSIAAHALAAAVAAATAQPRVAVAPGQQTTVLAMRVIADPAAGSATTLQPAVQIATVAPVAALPPTPAVPLAHGLPAPAATAAAMSAADDYLPRELLTQPPVASGLIVVQYPAELPPGSRHSLTLMLYVDEAGVVRRVRTEGSAPVQAMVTAAHQTFLHARFTPGQIDGRAVKSLMEVEVTFDSTPLGDAP